MRQSATSITRSAWVLISAGPRGMLLRTRTSAGNSVDAPRVERRGCRWTCNYFVSLGWLVYTCSRCTTCPWT